MYLSVGFEKALFYYRIDWNLNEAFLSGLSALSNSYHEISACDSKEFILCICILWDVTVILLELWKGKYTLLLWLSILYTSWKYYPFSNNLVHSIIWKCFFPPSSYEEKIQLRQGSFSKFWVFLTSRQLFVSSSQ